MNFLQDRIKALFGKARRAPELSDSVVRHDKLDEGAYHEMTERALGFRRAANEAPEIDLNALDPEGKLTDEQREKIGSYFAWEDLFKDTFQALHTFREPEMLPPEEVKPSRELNRRTMQQLVQSDAFQRLRLDTRHDELTSMCVTMSMADRVRETFATEISEQVAHMVQMRETEEQMSQLPPEPGDGADDPHGEQRQQLADQLAQQQAEAEQQNVGRALAQAAEDAANEGEEMADAISALPGNEAGEGVRLPPDKFLELAEKYRSQPTLRRVAELAGRMQRHMSAARARRVVGGREEIVDVTPGNDLSLLLPSQLALAGNPLSKYEFARRYSERQLLQYETVGTEHAGMGPVCISLDGSGSMGGPRNEWARSIALAIVSIAKRERRDAMVVEFDGRNTKVWEFLSHERMDPEQVLDFATHFFAGGTDNTLGVNMALKFMHERPEFEKADLVVLTDGHDNWQDDDIANREELTRLGARVHGVSIGMPIETNRYLTELSDTLITAHDMLQPSGATEQLAQAIT